MSKSRDVYSWERKPRKGANEFNKYLQREIAICLAPFLSDLTEYARFVLNRQDSICVEQFNVYIHWGNQLPTGERLLSLPTFAETSITVRRSKYNCANTIAVVRRGLKGRLRHFSSLLNTTAGGILPKDLQIIRGSAFVKIKKIPKAFVRLGTRRLSEVLEKQRKRRSDTRKRYLCKKRVREFLSWVAREKYAELCQKMKGESTELHWLNHGSSLSVIGQALASLSIVTEHSVSTPLVSWHWKSEGVASSSYVENFADVGEELKNRKIDINYSPRELTVVIPSPHELLVQIMDVQGEQKQVVGQELEPMPF